MGFPQKGASLSASDPARWTGNHALCVRCVVVLGKLAELILPSIADLMTLRLASCTLDPGATKRPPPSRLFLRDAGQGSVKRSCLQGVVGNVVTCSEKAWSL